VAVTDWRLAGTGANDSSVGNAAWSNPGNIVASNDSRAVTATMSAGQTSQILRATNFGFSIPSGSTIDGIEVRIERSRTSSGGNQVQDNLIRLRKSTGQVGDNKAVGGNWPNNDTQTTYGGDSDVWSSSFTVDEINNSGFGVDIRCERSGGTAAAGGVDAVEIRVHYTEGGTEYSRTPSDSVSFSDASTKSVGKLLSDSVSFSDQITKTISMVLADSISFTDQISKNISKGFEDDVSFTDDIDVAIVKTIDLGDSVSFTDQLIKSSNKAVSDAIELTDALTKQADKGIQDQVEFTDQAIKNISKPLNDDLALSDELTKQTNKVLSDSFSLSDDEDVQLITGGDVFDIDIFDTVSFTDNLTKSITKHNSDSVSFADSALKSQNKHIDDNIQFLDQPVKHISKPLNSGLSINDNISKELQRLLTDNILFEDLEDVGVFTGVTYNINLLDDIVFADSIQAGISEIRYINVFPKVKKINEIAVKTSELNKEISVSKQIDK